MERMEQLLQKIEGVRRSPAKSVIDNRLQEFKQAGQQHSNHIFKEACFCIMTANFTAERSIMIHTTIGNGFLDLPEKQLALKLKKLGHRFPNTRAKYITEARKHKDTIKKTINGINDEQMLRQWIMENIKGLGIKESSHFLRNIGFDNYAIIDFHVVDILHEHKMIKRPKTMTVKNYIKVENRLSKLCEKAKMTQAELDLYLWYLETGKILK